MKWRFSIVGIIILLLPSVSSARDEVSGTDTIAAFEYSAEIVPAVTLPTVVEVPVTDPSFRRGGYVVYESTTKSFQPSLYKEELSMAPASVACTTDRAPSMGNVANLCDKISATSVEFPVNADVTTENRVQLTVSFSREVAATGFLLGLEPFVALPRSAEVSAMNADGSSRIVLSRTALTGQAIRFPKTTAKTFLITLHYIQPLRINELSFFDEDALLFEGRSVRFLARPGESYVLYFQPDRSFGVSVGEAPNLSIDRDVKELAPPAIRVNPLFRPADTDGDGIRDTLDNCVRVANPDQADENGNGLGDVCDDYDKDGIVNSLDNCPSHPNRDQLDTDGDGKGDVCDGVESRLTESRPWLPWVAMGFGAIVVVSLFVATLRGTKHNL